MEAYSSFAQVYDLFMDNVPYEEWSRYLISLLKEYQVTDGTVVELGCGTGKMTRLLADAGYDMVGVDNSAEMLEIAGERRRKKSWRYFISSSGYAGAGIVWKYPGNCKCLRFDELYFGTGRSEKSI